MGTARRSLLFSFGERYTALLLATVGSMLIARMLAPADIGVYSIGAVLVGLAQVLRDFGVGQYVVATPALGRAQLRAALAVALASAWLLALLVLCASGPVAAFYGEPRLRDVLRLLALNFVLLPFTALTLSLLRRQLRLASIYVINTAHASAQLLCTLWLAAHGYGCLSLAWGAAAATLTAFAVSLPLRPAELPWLPALAGVRDVLRFGVPATGGNVIDEAGVAAPDLIVGKLLGVADVALFGKAQGLLSLFSQAVTSAIAPVMLPLFAAQARAGRDLRASYLLTVSCMTAVAWPFFALLALLALPIINILYGGQWDGAAGLIRIMCCSAALYSMFSMARYLFVAAGQVRVQARLDTLAVAVRVAAVLPAALVSLHWVAAAVVLGSVFRCWLTWRYLEQFAGIGAAALLAAVARSAVVTALTSLAPLAAVLALPPGTAQLLVAVAGAVPLWLAGIVLCRHPLAREIECAWRKVVRGDVVRRGG
ncbi:oligosaccharide flippase family protein [Massilia sp. YMA4]|uniref:oligosaccharide flippase family protein n=1 Tax=Massilia sp. YMA4 TaxID=1593482 RepID=UPI000DD18231|nr:oligosaccharide flippase family protein [Massilia sp. YMA4]AXA90805.1 lipopolysaccharide biosynthesis protein [Massilia sp. YMA4]